jgi:2-(1,2-epoxy-1,2-dihydrophenyl)acetyl-CoA isomerase
MSDDTILTGVDEHGVLTVTLNRPKAKNAFDTAMQRRMIEIFHDAGRDPGALAQKWAADPVWGAPEARFDRLQHFVRAPMLLHRMPKPTIAMVRGAAAGAGMSLALACDFRVVAENAFFMTSFARIGMSGDFGGSYFLTKLVGPSRAKELYMLSERVTAQDAERLGFVNRVVVDAALESETRAIAHRLAAGAPIALRYIKENVHAALDESVEQAFDVESRNMIRTRLTEDAREAMQAFLEKRDPAFKGL